MEGTTVQRPHATAALACSTAALLLASLTACDSAPEADTRKPTTPGHVTARAGSATSAHVMWEQAADNKAVTGYEVYRRRRSRQCMGSGAQASCSYAGRVRKSA
ncbi:hypothetical protein [Streptomyces sp. NBC_01618]|uniref:hypothetical protein n=1 Tax=Streptomyces sp. NBC_01618 TaxID=2975900 RepID=UPI003864AE82